MIFLQQRPCLLLVCCSLPTPGQSLQTDVVMYRSLSASRARCVRQAHDRLPLRRCNRYGNGGLQHGRKRPFWVSARGGGSTGKPPPLSAGVDPAAEKTLEPRAAESAHLKLRTMGQGKRAPATPSTAPWRWVVVDQDKEQQEDEEVASPAEENSSEVTGMVDAAASRSAGEASSDGRGGSGRGSVGENGGTAANEGEDDRLPPGKVRLLEYRAPPPGAGAEGERGETQYASLGDDVSKFITFLESPVARGLRDEDADELGLAGAAGGAAGVGTERRIFASTVEIGEEGLQKSLKGLWGKGRLLSQERDAANVLRGQEKSFSELLASCTDRTKSNHWEEIPPERLLETLEAGYGPGARSTCGYDPARPAEEMLSSIKAVLEWFRNDFPYYYDRCHSCGNGENNTFVGFVHPTREEREFRAGRTEVYQCSACGGVSRFARYVAVSKVLETRRGRCGEYSVLMMRLLEALGYSCRWVVDWSDHVWVEARVGGKWVHIDPCEAAVDEPLLYESWGKKQTYILAFTPTEVVDVTEHYTSDYMAAKSRRDVDQDTMDGLLAEATRTLLAEAIKL